MGQTGNTTTNGSLRRSYGTEQVTFSSLNPVRRPLALLAAMWRGLKDSQDFALGLLKRDLKAQYRQSVLGILWIAIPPLFTALIFSWAKRMSIVNISETSIPYPAYVVVGVILWQIFSEAIWAPMNGLQSARNFITKVPFPPEGIILAKLGEVLIGLIPKLILIVAVVLWYGLSFNFLSLFILLASLALVLLGFSLGMILTPFSLLFQDFSRSLSLILTVWLFLTPALYPMPTNDGLGLIVRYNPVSPLIEAGRTLFIENLSSNQTAPLFGFFCVFGASILMFFFGWVFIRISLPFLVERLN